MPISSKNRQFAIIGGFAATAAVAFAFGRMTSWLDKPIAGNQPAQGQRAGTVGNGTEGGQGSSALNGRIGGSFEADSGTPGTSLTVEQVTSGQPLEDWLKKLMAQDDDLYRMQNLLRLIDSLHNPEDIKAALKIVGTTRGGGRGGPFNGRFTEYGMLMEKFTQLDPKGALSYASEQQGGEKFMATSSALRTWTRLDPAAALAWAQNEGAALQFETNRGGPGGPGGEGQDNQPKENFALLSVISQLAKTDIDKAILTASTTEIGRFGNRTVETLASELITQRGADAARKMVDSLPDGSFKNEYIQQVAGRLADKDAPGTATWAMDLPAGDAKRRALGEAIDEWVKTDATAAGNFLAKLPASTDTDSARETYARGVVKNDPAAALTWAATITEPDRRGRTAVNLASDIIRQDQVNGLQIVNNSTTLSDDQKAQAVARANDRRNGGGGGQFNGFRGAPGGRAGGR